MLIISETPNKKISIKANYFYSSRIRRAVPNAVFDYNAKQYVIEKRELCLIENNFKGEIYWKTPRWVIYNEPAPDYSQQYKLSQEYEIPPLKCEPYNYQKYGIQFMIDKIIHNGFVLNSDDVGLGKTIQTIGAMQWFIQNKEMKKILIICKKTIKTQWAEEINKFTDLSKEFMVKWTEKTKKHRLKVYEEVAQTDKAIMITNYHTFLNDSFLIKDLDFDLIVIDEIHSIKARDGVLNNNIAYVCENKPSIFLTGTPIMSKPADVFGIVQIANPQYFGSWNTFAKNFLTINYDTPYGPQIVGAKNMDILREKIQNIIIRRTEYEVSIDLPKTVVENKMCRVDKTQQDLIQAISEQNEELTDEIMGMLDSKTKNVLPGKEEEYEKKQAMLKGLIALKQGVASDPRILLRSSSKMVQKYSDLIPNNYKMSGKTERALDIIEDVVESDNKVIIFTKYRMAAEMLKADIEKELKYNVLLYTGAQDAEARDENIKLFKTSEQYNILIGTEAMAEGLNLQVAKYLINYDLPDTAAIYIQRIGRCRRASSQYDKVFCYNLLTEESKDISKMNNILQNMDLAGALVEINEAQRQTLLKEMSKYQ